MHQAMQLSVSSQVTITMIPKYLACLKGKDIQQDISVIKQVIVMFHWVKSSEANRLTILQKYA